MIMTGKMFEDDKKLTLLDVISKIPHNTMDWYLFEINGVGTAPDNLTMLDFEELVKERDEGYKFSWSELEYFARNIEDINDIILVSSPRPITFDELNRNNVDVYVEIFDSNSWEVIFNRNMEAIDIVKKLLETEDLDMFSKDISDISSEETLYLFVCNFNYDGNIDKLYYIIDHPLCSRNVALKIFYLLDGYSFLLGDLDIFSDQSVLLLLDRLYNGFVSNLFSKGNIEIQSEFTKVQIYKLKKVYPNIPTDILFGIEGNFIDSTLCC